MELSILTNIVIIFALSTGVNLVFTRLKIPTVVGYLLTGIIAGPKMFSLVTGDNEIEILAEIGVALLLFTIGMEFSLKHLMKIRRMVFFGGVLQVGVTAAVFYLVSKQFGLNWQTGLFIGFLVALSSSAMVLKLLQERSELTSNYGHTVLGILIFQDLLLVPLLLFSNILSDSNIDLFRELVILTLKASFIITLVFVGNKWILPKLLHIIAMTKNQELFLMSIFLICFSIALLTWKLGMSIAFGAFLAGLMISESEYSHNAFANLLPFKDTFSSFFFVSIGMMLDISFIMENPLLILLSVVLVIILKTIIAGGTGFLLGHTFKGTIMVGIALCQVGEFSFILAGIGHDLLILNDLIFQQFLAVAVITMALTPFLMKLSSPLANFFLKFPLPDFMVNGLFPLKEVFIPEMENHLVIIGKDASAIKLSAMADYYKIQHVSIIFDPMLAKVKIDKGDRVVYGDAVNEPILLKAHVDKAETIVVSVGDVIPAMAIVEKIRKINSKGRLIARTHKIENVNLFYKLGVDEVLPEKLEIALDLFNRLLTSKMLSISEINRMLNHMRYIQLGEFIEKDTINKLSFFDEFANTKISSIHIDSDSIVINKSIKDLDIRQKIGVTILAVKRGEEIFEHPIPTTILKQGDIVFVIGNDEQIESANTFFQQK
jgi:CPA2 family monovalent cation:H+ antiporter-2